MKFRKIEFLTLAFFISFMSNVLWAAPARNEKFIVEQPDKSTLTIIKKGSELFHFYLTSDNIPLFTADNKSFYYADINREGATIPSAFLAHNPEDRLEEENEYIDQMESRGVGLASFVEDGLSRAPSRTPEPEHTLKNIPSKGNVNIPVLLVQFQDKAFSYPADSISLLINGDNYNGGGAFGSARDYFISQSDSQFIPNFHVIGPLTVTNNMAYYGENDYNGYDKLPEEMVREACLLADSLLDFSIFDNNGDGFVDEVYVIYAGYGEASASFLLENTIWPHASSLSGEYGLSLDGVSIFNYGCSNELSGYEGTIIDGIGIFCHEFSHALGLPDFYDTMGYNYSMGRWSIMDYGCYNNNSLTPCGYTAYEKEFMGWITIDTLYDHSHITTLPVSNGGKAYRILNDANPDEYLILENRQQNGWDTYLPSHGLLITHVDYSEKAWLWNRVNIFSNHLRLAIVPADNIRCYLTENDDTYPGTTGKTAFNDATSPASVMFTGSTLGKPVIDISESLNGTVSFLFLAHLLPATKASSPLNISSTSFTARWDGVANCSSYTLELFEIEDEDVASDSLLLIENFDNFNDKSLDMSLCINNLTNQAGWLASRVFSEDGYCKIGTSLRAGYLVTPTLNIEIEDTFTIHFKAKLYDPADLNAELFVGSQSVLGFIGNNISKIPSSEWGEFVYIAKAEKTNPIILFSTMSGGSHRVAIDDIKVFKGDMRNNLNNSVKLNVTSQIDSPLRILRSGDLSLDQSKMSETTTQIISSSWKMSKFSNINDTSFTFRNLETHKSYRYRVMYYINNRESGYSNSVLVTLPGDKNSPPVPSAITTSHISDSSFVISWKRVEGASSYVVEMQNSPFLYENTEETETSFNMILHENFLDFRAQNKKDYGIDRVLDSYTIHPGWKGKNVFSDNMFCILGSDNEFGYLTTPYLRNISGPVSVIFSVKKTNRSDGPTKVSVSHVTEQFSDTLRVIETQYLNIDNDYWTTFICVLNNMGKNSAIRFSSQNETFSQLDLSNISIYLGDIRLGSKEQLTQGITTMDDSIKNFRSLNNNIDRNPKLVDEYFSVQYFSTADTFLTVRNLSKRVFNLRIRSKSEESLSDFSSPVSLAIGNTWFIYENYIFEIISFKNKTVRITKNSKNRSKHIIIPETVTCGDTYTVVEIKDGLFHGNQNLISIRIPSSIIKIGNRVFEGCKNLSSVIWECNTDIPPGTFAGANPNLLVYIDNISKVYDKVNVIRNNHIDSIVLIDKYPFNALKGFRVNHISLSKEMIQTSGLDESCGWETIALPFTVQRTWHESAGLMVPFKEESPIIQKYWLAEWSDSGFISAGQIEANKPYLISIPNNPGYVNSQNLPGIITFYAENTYIQASDSIEQIDGKEFVFIPALSGKEIGGGSFSLNSYDLLSQAAPGSLFLEEFYSVKPFGAYFQKKMNSYSASKLSSQEFTIHLTNTMAQNAENELPERVSNIYVYFDREILTIHSGMKREISIFNTEGKLIGELSLSAGNNRVENLPPGLYVIANKIVLIK